MVTQMGSADIQPPHHFPRLNRQRIARIIVGISAFFGLFMFLPAGTLLWLEGWVFIGVFLLLETAIVTYLWRKNPELLIARSQIHQGTKQWDKILLYVLFPLLASRAFPN